MHDPFGVRGGERLGCLSRDQKRLVERDRATRHAPREVLSRDQLHHQQETALELLEAVDVGDVRVIQGGERPGFALEARTSRRIRSQRVGQNLDRHVATKPGVVSAIHFTHPARAERADDFVRTETVSDAEAQWHLWRVRIIATSPGMVVASDAPLAARRNRGYLIELFFESNRPGSAGVDLWVATRLSTSAAWNDPVNLTVLNSGAFDGRPSISSHGDMLYCWTIAACLG
jgi:hypothetical protein